MKNTYEFNIEDINSVIVALNTGSLYTTTYKRKYDEEGNPTDVFVRTYDAEPDDSCGNGNVILICNRCERWTEVSKEEINKDDYEFKCGFCSEDYEELVDDNDVIAAIQAALEPDTYFNITLVINDITIV